MEPAEVASKTKVIHRAPIRCYLINESQEICRILQWPVSLENCTVQTLIDDLSRVGYVTKVILHGVELSFETPILWLALNSAYADNFLHLVMLM